MSQERKLLKIFCFLLVACGVACVVVGAASFAGAGAVAPELQVWSYGLGAWGGVGQPQKPPEGKSESSGHRPLN